MDRSSRHCTGGNDQDHPQEKDTRKGEMVSEEALQIAEKRKDTKGKGEKERYTCLNAEFQRIERRDKKPSSVINAKKQRKTAMGKTKDLFKKIRDTTGTFHANMGSIKDRNNIDLTEAENIKKRQKEYTEE